MNAIIARTSLKLLFTLQIKSLHLRKQKTCKFWSQRCFAPIWALSLFSLATPGVQPRRKMQNRGILQIANALFSCNRTLWSSLSLSNNVQNLHEEWDLVKAVWSVVGQLSYRYSSRIKVRCVLKRIPRGYIEKSFRRSLMLLSVFRPKLRLPLVFMGSFLSFSHFKEEKRSISPHPTGMWTGIFVIKGNPADH